jgi:predicted RNase H-like nuclease (RuvC/YqgF family)
VKEIQLFEDKHRFSITEYEECIKQHEDNVLKYKKERESLARTIEEQQKEIDMIHLYLERRKVESRTSEPEKIIVHVNKDGSYQKTVERVTPNQGSSGNGVAINARGNKRR